jgi:hypothetical protein
MLMMFDDLEGLDYLPDECAKYVEEILNDIQRSINRGHIVPIRKPEIGDVVVERFRSRLVKDLKMERMNLSNTHALIPRDVLLQFRKTRNEQQCH